MLVFKKGSYNSEQLRELYDVIYSANYFLRLTITVITLMSNRFVNFARAE